MPLCLVFAPVFHNSEERRGAYFASPRKDGAAQRARQADLLRRKTEISQEICLNYGQMPSQLAQVCKFSNTKADFRQL
jgi:hypothetical protein